MTPETGRVWVRRVVSAIDSGEAVHPDGIRNQTEGGILQALSWTLLEEVIFDTTRVTSPAWSSYPILRFAGVPDEVEVHVIDRPGETFLGTGEAPRGRPRQRSAMQSATPPVFGCQLCRLRRIGARGDLGLSHRS